MRSVLLLGAYFLSVDEVVRRLHVWRQNSSAVLFAGVVHGSNLMLMVVHFEQLLLLRS